MFKLELWYAEQVWLKQPLVDLKEINERHDIVEAITADLELCQQLRDIHLRGVALPSLHVHILTEKPTQLAL